MLRATAVLAMLCSTVHADDLCRKDRRPGAKIDLDLKDAPVADVLQLIADTAKVNVVIPDDVTGKVTVHLRGVAWDRAACAIAASHGFRIDEDGGVLVVKSSRR